MIKEVKRIPFNNRINSHLSVARHYWGIKVNGDYYEYDHEVLKQMSEDLDDWRLYKPDLVLYETIKKPKGEITKRQK